MKNSVRSIITTLAFLCVGVLLNGQAVSPPPDGGYANQTTAEGANALFSLTTGINNTAVGFDTLWHNTTGGYNTATGEQTLFSNVSGNYNTATGYRALYSNTASMNTAEGFKALYNNSNGFANTASGFQALFSNTGGFANTAVGFEALDKTVNANHNTAVGYGALFANTVSDDNTAVGFEALYNSGGSLVAQDNVAMGSQALYSNLTGRFNTANGSRALNSNYAGSYNTALGFYAGSNVTEASNVICIGANILGANVSNSCFIGSIRDVTTRNGDAIPVVIDSAGQLGTVSSSQRFKEEIKPIDKVSESLLALKPVTFRYKSDKIHTSQFGLIAEEVAKVNPDLVVCDHNGEIYTVRYDAVNAMLLNEFLKEHHQVQDLKAAVASLAATVKEQAAQLQKVSAQLEMSKPAAKVVSTNL
jgi:hypothetical protein